MTGFAVRPITDEERRPTFTLLRQALHSPPPDDEFWRQHGDAWVADHKFGAFAGDRPIGITGSFDTDLVVPGGARLSTAAVDGVAVRADWTRRGVVSELMRVQLQDFAARGHALAALYPSEAAIYGRFGYGAATLGRTIRVEHPARLRPGVPATGTVRLLDETTAAAQLPALYQQCATTRPGRLGRPAAWWPIERNRQIRYGAGYRVAVHTGHNGEDDGFVVFRSRERATLDQPDRRAALDVRDLIGAGPAAVTGLWRFLLSIDLTGTVLARDRPVDEPVGALLTDPRRAHTDAVTDQLWLRLVDVPAALAARTYGAAEPVVLALTDRQLPANTGRYLIGPGGAHRTQAPAELDLDAEALGQLYLGEWRASTLWQAGRLTAADPSAAARADALFTTERPPWCGTHF
ncbi:GNAT family N-acetyltransferase [Amycolatopsis sp. PS_44_ISF1]|uniref:GNAT family N-acetyltransferase n=1 Tax=Amycolatopsis sp. PS_44_ISF1 TaxID=2974917 RepID=UPI0028E00871|nr:GNAT family N-acetyltransferase [Amycolatopsis sp. PS_44_ISF1]MDT8912714.1 GNAT family N-acetyltransferase [Amycolatopsis sp. PS_44_ISF1]